MCNSYTAGVQQTTVTVYMRGAYPAYAAPACSFLLMAIWRNKGTVWLFQLRMRVWLVATTG